MPVYIISPDNDVRVIKQSGPLAVQTFIGSADSKLSLLRDKPNQIKTDGVPRKHKVGATALRKIELHPFFFCSDQRLCSVS